MTSPFIDWIWNVRGSLALAPGQSSDQAFERLDPLFHETGTRHEWTGDTLNFRKKDQPAQDKMAVFDSGTLKIENSVGGPVLRYRLTSRALLFCFLAPLLFLGFAQLTIAMAKLEKPAAEASKSAKAADAAKKHPVMQLNPIDKFLGAPAPEKPKKDGAEEGRHKKPSPTPAYVFAVLFALLYAIGRVLEARQVRTLFRKALDPQFQ